jgi:hypothetical protein
MVMIFLTIQFLTSIAASLVRSEIGPDSPAAAGRDETPANLITHNRKQAIFQAIIKV